MTQVTPRLTKMAAESNRMSSGRKPLFRQMAVKDGFDSADGMIVATKHYYMQPGHSQHVNKSKGNTSYYQKQILPNSSASQTNTSVLQELENIQLNCQTPADENVSKTIRQLAKYMYSEQLTSYNQLLLKQRNRETISYRQGLSLRETSCQNQTAKKSSKRRDVSDGLPVSSGALLATYKRKKNVSAQHKDLCDVLPSSPETLSLHHPAVDLEGTSEGKNLPQKSRRSLDSEDEGLENGNVRRLSSSNSPSLFDIQEMKVLPSGDNIPKIEVNGVEKKSLSESGRQKGEGFRQSKKSSGYCTGGSDDIPEGENFSSVFLSAEKSVDRVATHADESIEALYIPREEACSQSTKVFGKNKELEYNTENFCDTQMAPFLGREVECKDSTLPPGAPIWGLDKSPIKSPIKIPPKIRAKDQYIDNMTHSEHERLFKEILQANPQRPLESVNPPDIRLEEVHLISHTQTEEDENKRCEEELDYLENMCRSLNSKDWAEDLSEERQRSEDLTEDSATSEEYVALHFSKESEPSHYLSGNLSIEPVSNGIKEGENGPDEVDGKRGSPVNTSSSATAKMTPWHYPVAKNFETGSTCTTVNGGRCACPEDWMAPSHQPAANGLVVPSHCRGTSGFTDLEPRSEAINRGKGIGPEDLMTQTHQSAVNGLAVPSHRRRASGFTDQETRYEAVNRGRCTSPQNGMAPSHEPEANGLAVPNHREGAIGFMDQEVRAEAEGTDAAAKRILSQHPVRNGCAFQNQRNCSRINGYFLVHLDRAIFCKKSFCNTACMQGKNMMLRLQNLFQADKIKDGRNILESLWHHSRSCQEIECVVPFCHVFRKRSSSSFEEHFADMCSGSINIQLQLELKGIMEKQVKMEDFLQLSPSSSVSHLSWITACVSKGQFLGDFGDFNILRGHISFKDNQPLDVVIKKAISHKDSKNVYFKINQKSSPYIVENYWCSSVSDDTLLVCSALYPDMISLHYFVMSYNLTSDLCLTLLRQLVLAAQYLHTPTLYIVYLNWKCSNVILDLHSMNIKLCNFSKAVQLEQGCVVACPANIINCFDPHFTAPEVLCGEPLSFYSDVWGLGCLLNEMLTKCPPYPEHSHRSPAELREMVRCNQIEHVYQTEDDDLLEILCRCWERKPSDRWTTERLLKKLLELEKHC